MKLICEYCDAYVEIEENSVCPLCGAPMGAAIAVERARLANEKALQRQHEEEMQKLQKEAIEKQEKMRMIGTIVGSVASGLIGYSTGSRSVSLRGPGTGILAKLGAKALASIFGKR